MCEILMAEIFLIFFLTFISLFSLIIYLVRVNNNDKGHFLTYVLTFYNLPCFTIVPLIMKAKKNLHTK